MTSSRRFATLDGIRGVAALVIVAYHEWTWLGALTPQGGFLAVDLFFVLSGFVIASAYGRRMAAGSMSTRDFLKVRVIRLYPLFFLGLMMGASLMLLSLVEHRRIIPTEAAAWWSFLPGLFMLPCPPLSTSTPLYPLDNVFWSLLFELLVNMLYAFTWRLWRPWAIVAAMAVSGAVIIATGASDFTGWDWQSFGMDIARVMYSFPAGVLIWQLIHERGWRTPGWLPSPLILLAAASCFLSRLPVAIEFSTLVAFPAIVFLGAQSEPRNWFAAVFTQLGLASYAIYALHYPVLDGLTALLTKLHRTSPGLGLALAFPLATVLAALAVDRFYDAPVRRKLTQLTRAT